MSRDLDDLARAVALIRSARVTYAARTDGLHVRWTFGDGDTELALDHVVAVAPLSLLKLGGDLVSRAIEALRR